MPDETITTSNEPVGSNGAVQPTTWYSSVPPELQTPAVKEAPDLPTFVKRFEAQHTELGRAQARIVPDPAKQPNEFKAFQESVKKAGLSISADPPVPDDWQYTRPEEIPEHFWFDEDAADFAKIAKQNGISEKAAKELINVHNRGFERVAKALDAYTAEAKTAVTNLWKDEGRTYDEMMALATRGIEARFTEEEYNALHMPMPLGNGKMFRPIDSPQILSALAKIGEVFAESRGLTGPMTPEARNAKAEADAIIMDKNNPRYEAFHRGDAEAHAYVQSLYKKADPGTYTG